MDDFMNLYYTFDDSRDEFYAGTTSPAWTSSDGGDEAYLHGLHHRGGGLHDVYS
jgi:hypothetical protein